MELIRKNVDLNKKKKKASSNAVQQERFPLSGLGKDKQRGENLSHVGDDDNFIISNRFCLSDVITLL